MTVRRDIVAGQTVADGKVIRSRELRRDMTPAERALWACLRDRRLAGWKFRRQQVIDGFIADFYCADAGLVVELDGAVHDRQAAADAERDGILMARRLTVLRVRNERVAADLAGVLWEIEEWCRAGRA
jgi:very-short-patch-repair endonuclease